MIGDNAEMIGEFAAIASSMLGGGGGGVPMSGAATNSMDSSGWSVNFGGGKAASWAPVLIAGAAVLAVVLWASRR